MPSNPPRQPVLVTHSSTPGLLRHLPFILNSLNTQLPLRNLHWKTSTRPSIRTIQECDLRFISLIDAQSKGDVSNWHPPDEVECGNLLSQCPLIHVCFIECEDNDAYKASCRPYLNTWISSIPAMHHSQKIIVLVNTPPSTSHKNAESKGGVFGNIRNASTGNPNSAVLSKMKADFEIGSKERATDNTPTRTRCISLTLPSAANQAQFRISLPDPTLFVDLLQALKESALVAFDSIIAEREDIVRKSEAYMHSPPSEESWNFRKYFLIKECLACTFENMGLIEDALLVYDELEESLALVMREHLAWIGRPGIDTLATNEQLISPQADWNNILRERQEDRLKISGGDFSIFDLRCFLFRRQSEMLHVQPTLSPIVLAQSLIQRAVTFISSFGRWLRSQKSADPTLIEAWIYDASYAVDEVSVELSRRHSQNNKEERTNGFTSLNRVRTELLNLAVLQLDRIGIKEGFLPASPPFMTSSLLMPQQDAVLFDRPDASPAMADLADPTKVVTRQPSEHGLRVLTKASQDNQIFQSLYDSALDRARQAEIGAGRVRGKQALEEKLAANAYFHEQWQTAYDSYLDLSQQYKADEARMTGSARAKWSSLRMNALSRALRCHTSLHLPITRTFTMLGLEFLKVYAETVEAAEPGQTQDRKAVEVETAAKIVQSWEDTKHDASVPEMEILEHPIFYLSLADNEAKPLIHEDGSACTIHVRNLLPVDVCVSELRVCFSSTEIEQLWFTANTTVLKPGTNHIEVTCLMPVTGVLCMQSARLSKDGMIFEYVWSNQPAEAARVLHLPRNPLSLQASARIARDISLASEPYFEVMIQSGRNDVYDAVLSVSSSRQDVRFRTHAVKADTDLSILASRENIRIPNLPKNSHLLLSLPYACPIRLDTLDVRISLNYETADRRGLRRTFRESHALDLELPVAVNVQDFFRPECLISKFTVSSATQHAIRIVSAKLSDADTGYRAESFNPDCRPSYITADRAVPYLFKIIKAKNVATDSPSIAATPAAVPVLKLILTYSILGEELESIVQEAILARIDVAKHPFLVREICEHLMRLFLQEDWLARYVANGKILVPPIAKDVPAHIAQEIRNLEQFFANADLADAQRLKLRTLTVPVEIPPMQAIFSSQVIFPASSRFIVGKPITVQISLVSSHSWADDEVTQDLQMIYDVLVDKENWLVTGKKRGTFSISASEAPFIVTITLIPLRHGLLPHPSIVAQPSPLFISTTSKSQRLAQASVPMSFENHQIDAASHVMVHPAPAQQILMQVVREVAGTTDGSGSIVS